MNCPQCNNPLSPDARTCEHCAPLPVPETLPFMQGHVEVENVSDGVVAGMYVREFHQHHALPPPVSWRGRLSRNVPQSNPFFTGREAELTRLHTLLHSGNAALTPVPQALQGLGGIGKTSTACEYAHRFRQEYEGVFWVRGETPEQLASQLAGLAAELFPSEAVPADQKTALQQVQDWFAAHENWLLVVDNAEHLSELAPVLPSWATGRLLLTTREKATGVLAQRVEIERLDEADGALLLLRRANKLTHAQTLDAADASWQEGAKAVSREVDGLPLALDQAGAYIESRTLTPQKYLDYYRKRRQQLHADYTNPSHLSVSVTFSLALEQVQQIPERGMAAVQLAQCCAFLAPDAVPDEVFLTYPAVLPDALARYAQDEIAFVEVCEAACRYALLRREADPPALSMHRLAQEVLRDRLNAEERKATSEQAMEAVNEAFPTPHFPTWDLCARLLPHALACIPHMEEHTLHTLYASRLLYNTGSYLQDRARYEEAEPLLLLALAIRRQVHGEEHAYVATALNILGVLYRDRGRYEEAAACLEQAVAIARRVLGDNDAEYAIHLDNLAGVYYLQHRYEEATALRKQALDVTRRALGSQHPQVAIRLGNLANVYTSTRRYAEAETLLVEALSIGRESIGEAHPDYATRLLNLAGLYIQCSRAAEAEPLLTQALAIYTQAQGSQHPAVAACHYWQGRMHYAQGNQADALVAFGQAWALREYALGPQHPDTGFARSWLEGVGGRLPSSGLRPPSPCKGEG